MPPAAAAAATATGCVLGCTLRGVGAPPELGDPCRPEEAEGARDGVVLPAVEAARDDGGLRRLADTAPASGSWCCTCV